MLTDGLPGPLDRFLYRSFPAGPAFVEQVREIREAHPETPVAFAMQSGGIVEFWVLRRFLRQAFGDSFAPRYATRVWGIFGEPLKLNLKRIASIFGIRKKVSRIQICARELKAGRSIVMNFRYERSKAFQTPKGEQELGVLQEALEQFLIVPTNFVWQRKRTIEKERSEKISAKLWRTLISPLLAVWNFVLGDPFSPTFNRKVALMAIGYRHSTLRAGSVLMVDSSSSPKAVRRHVLMDIQKERRVILGPSFRSTKTIGETVFRDPSLNELIEHMAKEAGKPKIHFFKKAVRYFREMAAMYSYSTVDVSSWFLRLVFGNIFEGLTYEEKDFKRLREASKEGPLVFIPTHKSYVDFLLLSHLMHEKQIAPPHIIAGINLNFWPFGSIAKRGGAIFIRRSFKDAPLYGAVLKRYVSALMANRINLEFFIEGARSRNGKLMPPKFGILKMITDNYLAGNFTEKVRFVPMSMIYDRVTEDGSHRKELEGGDKVPESFTGLFKATKVLRKNFGKVHIRVGEIIPIEEWAAKEVGGETLNQNINRLAVQKLAFQISHNINAASPLTSVGIVSAVLLLKKDARWSRSEFEMVLMLLEKDIEKHNILLSDELQENFMHACRRAIARLNSDKLVEKFYMENGGIGYFVPTKQRLSVFYYKNTAIHALLGLAIAGLCQHNPKNEFESWDDKRLLRIRTILQFEFFFSEKEQFVKNVHAIMNDTDCALYAFLLDDYLETIHTGLLSLLEMQDLILGKKEWRSRLLKKARAFSQEGRVERIESINTSAINAFVELAINQAWMRTPPSDSELLKTATAEKLRDSIDFVEKLRAPIKQWHSQEHEEGSFAGKREPTIETEISGTPPEA